VRWTRHDISALLRDDKVRSISRRYFISNGFDGTLTSVGVATGAFLSGVSDGWTTFVIGLGAAVGLATSGVWSVWEIERAEKILEIKRLEQAMLADLDDTRIQRRQRGARAINAIASGIGPIIGILFPMVPFLFEGRVLTMFQAAALAVGIGVGLLFIFGAYMARIAGLRWYVAGIRMGLAGLVVAGINLLFPGGWP
jgi:predicted membrane protein (TIGR00267 family)